MLAVGGAGFPVPGWLVIAVVAAVVLGGGLLLLWKFFQVPPWIDVEGFSVKFNFKSPPPWSETEITATRVALKRAIGLSLEVLGSIWPPEAMLGALVGVNFIIEDSNTWFSKELGFMVAEETYAERKLISVGPNLHGVCHGLAHLFMWYLDHKEDPRHSQWQALGLDKAEQGYLERLDD